MTLRRNDVAIIVRDTMARGRETCFSKLIGTPLTMRDPVGELGGRRVWAYKGATLRCPMCKVAFPLVYEADLQPLRGPGAFSSTTKPATLPAATPARDLVTQ